jgi:nucleoside-diphosphate-sugar epimerase
VNHLATNVVGHVEAPALLERLGHYDICFHLAADMGGVPYISQNSYRCMIDIDPLRAVIGRLIVGQIDRVIFSSTACVYPEQLQRHPGESLRESSTAVAAPDTGYGWGKLFQERMLHEAAQAYRLDYGIARLFNVYGPFCSVDDGREKAPAAITNKLLIAKAAQRQSVQLLGSGIEVRSFMHVHDCVTGLILLADSSSRGPMNFASLETVTVRCLADRIARIVDYRGTIIFSGETPGVAARVPDINTAGVELDWKPTVQLESGLATLVAYVRGRSASDLSLELVPSG